MKERPILMTTESVKAILDGRKTLTRRVIKPQPKQDVDSLEKNDSTFHLGKLCKLSELAGGRLKAVEYNCPYGGVGDLLWVRETWTSHIDDFNHLCLVYYGDDADSIRAYPINFISGLFIKQPKDGKHPSIFMPRWASRLTLEIIEVRVERLQGMLWTDVIKEGINPQLKSPDATIEEFILLWNSLNAKRGYSWQSNPFVWVLSFKVAK